MTQSPDAGEFPCPHDRWIRAELEAIHRRLDERFDGSDRVWQGRVDALSKYVDTKFIEAQRAIDKAESSMGLRLDGMNEFREQLNRQEGTYLTRFEYDKRHADLEYRIGQVRDLTTQWKGQMMTFGVLGAAAWSLLLLFIAWWLHR